MKTVFSVSLGLSVSLLCFVTLQLPGNAAPPGLKPAPASFTVRPGQTNDEVSPSFQVSADPRDQVQLSIRNGIVTIKGTVATEELAQKVVQKYAHISGVREVRNELNVRNRDSGIAERVRDTFSRDVTTHCGSIAVTVYDGVVFLSGAVSSEEESTRAEELAGAVSGVRRVSNGLRTPAASRYNAQLTRAARSNARIR